MVTRIGWQAKKEDIASKPENTDLRALPFAAFEQQLGLSEPRCAQLTQCLRLLRKEEDKRYDVRLLRRSVLATVAAGAYKALELELPEHEVRGRIHNMKMTRARTYVHTCTTCTQTDTHVHTYTHARAHMHHM